MNEVTDYLLQAEGRMEAAGCAMEVSMKTPRGLLSWSRYMGKFRIVLNKEAPLTHCSFAERIAAVEYIPDLMKQAELAMVRALESLEK